MAKCKPVYIHESMSLREEMNQAKRELKQARKDRQDLLTALVAIMHRRKGVFDSWQLEQFGPLSTDMAEDMATIAKLAYNRVTTRSKDQL